MKNIMNWIKNLFIISAVSLIALKISDVIFGAIDYDRSNVLRSGSRNIILREHDPNQDLILIPDDRYMRLTDGLIQQKYPVSIDENGFIRNGNPNIISDETIVIAFMGGSTTETIYVDEKNRFPSVVERQLRKDYSPLVKTINAGVSGNNSFHSLLNFQTKVLPKKPKVVVLMHNINDFALLSKTGSYWRGPEGKNLVKEPSDLPNASSIINALRLVKNFLVPNLYDYLKPKLFPQLVVTDEFKNYREVGIDVHSNRTLSMFEKSLRSFIAVSNAWGVKPVLMTQFNRVNVNDEVFISYITSLGYGNDASTVVELYNALNEVTRNVAKDTNTYLIDLDILIPKSARYIYDIVHVNNEGSNLVGEIISNELIKILP